ncbi:hypothetical protein MNBD_GAMMA26-1429 [hydrothermal vent metagenome]|uniref:HPr kinase n=1 Tax=hydrothermal vent metagenome TaxID=652676 RepID=A0A3B1B5H4_9ZZZZ
MPCDTPIPFAVEVAGIRFNYSYPANIQLNPLQDWYLPFICHHGKLPNQMDITVELTFDDPPDTAALRTIFDTDGSWSLLTDGRDNYIRLDAPGSSEGPIWIAKTSTNFRHVRVHCGDVLKRTQNDVVTVHNVAAQYPLDQILFINILAHNQGLLIHSTGLSLDNHAFVFPAVSGGGKSTLSRLLIQAGIPGLSLLSDDRIIIRRLADGFHAFGTPWPGDAHIARNESAPLAGLYFLTQGTHTKVTPLPPKEILARLFPVSSIPWYDRALTESSLSLCEALLADVPAFDFQFSTDADEVAKAVSELPMAS